MHKKILEDISRDCPCNGEWCFLKELISHTGISDRQAEQLRLIYDYKFMKSKEEGIDIGTKRATMEFIAQYARRFSEVYQEGLVHEELFKRVFQIELVPITN